MLEATRLGRREFDGICSEGDAAPTGAGIRCRRRHHRETVRVVVKGTCLSCGLSMYSLAAVRGQ